MRIAGRHPVFPVAAYQRRSGTVKAHFEVDVGRYRMVMGYEILEIHLANTGSEWPIP